MRKRCEVIYETVQRYDQFKKEIDAFTNKAIDTLRLTSSDDEISDLKRYNKMNEVPIDKSAIAEVIGLENADKKRESRKKRLELSLSERIARVEETLEKIQNRISRRQKIVSDIENKYQRQGVELPENIQYQYDNTKAKLSELESAYLEKTQELEMLKRSLASDEEKL